MTRYGIFDEDGCHENGLTESLAQYAMKDYESYPGAYYAAVCPVPDHDTYEADNCDKCAYENHEEYSND